MKMVLICSMRAFVLLSCTVVLTKAALSSDSSVVTWPDRDVWNGCRAPVSTPVPDLPFDCTQKEKFPVEDYQRDLQEDETISAIVAEYEEPTEESSCPPEPPAEIPAPGTDCEDSSDPNRCGVDRKKRQFPHSWYSLCPSWKYYPWQWGITIPGIIGPCWIITPFSIHNCFSKYCWWGGGWPFYRCLPDYRRQYYLAYCPFNPRKFVFRWHLVSRGCCCHRYFCCNNFC